MDKTRTVKLLSININGNLSVLENSTCLSYMNEFDVIVLVELKCSYVFSVPGFTVMRSSDSGQRGGVGVLVKHRLAAGVFDVKLLNDQVWFRLSFMPGMKICACYIPPADSPYFSSISFSDIQSQAVESDSKVLLIGDVNSRMGDLNRLEDTERGIEYSSNVDVSENAHGRNMLNMCKNLDLYPVNHLILHGKCFMGAKTYRKREKWISQLDWLFCSSQLLSLIHSFDIVQNTPFKSDHAALAATVECPTPSVSYVLERAKFLGEDLFDRNQSMSKKAVNIDSVIPEDFNAALPDPVTWWHECENVLINANQPAEELSKRLTETLYNACNQARQKNRSTVKSVSRKVDDAYSRWQLLVTKKDPKLIWSSINWKGEFNVKGGEGSRPSNDDFQQHFERLLNPSTGFADITVPNTGVYVPILDDPFTMAEVHTAIRNLRRSKAAGVDGVPPGVFKLLAGEWLEILTVLFNLVFAGEYPEQWSYAKMFTIFKKGNAGDANNYRGISIQGALAKIYESVLNNRFTSWFRPDDEQAGGCAGKGCAEQLFTLRLLIDYARKTKQTLYIAYIDYVKAYDKVNRNVLLRKLADHGCGQRYLQAIASSLRDTSNVLGDVCFKSTAGVKQGAANSCSLFTFYINSTIRALKRFGKENYLESLHCLLFMDDTAVLATSRDGLNEKLALLIQAAKDIDMEIHPEKSKFMTINSNDKSPFYFDHITIGHVNKYVYLGSEIADASLHDQVKANVDMKRSHLIKFGSFLRKNSEAPFSVKKLVLDSALTSAVLYGCESWLCNNLQAAVSPILSAQKQLLAVRSQTCNDLVQIELAQPDGKTVIQETQLSFLRKLTNRSDFVVSPAHLALRLSRRASTAASSYVDKLLKETPGSLRDQNLRIVQERISESQSSRRRAYADLNGSFTYHPVYTSNVPEKARMAFTKLRLGSHRLKIETGRWSRIPRDERLCHCLEVQTETHVLLSCPLTESLRRSYSMLNFDNIISLMESSPNDLALYCQDVLGLYEVD